MNKIFILILVSFSLVSCQDITGELEMFKDISLKTQRGGKINLKEGVRTGTLRLRSKRKLRLVVGGKKIKFKIPRGIKLPTLNGSIRLKASEVKQNFDIVGDVKTDITRGPIVRSYESCSYSLPNHNCFNGPRGRNLCYPSHLNTYGTQAVVYRSDTHDKELVISLYEKNTDEIVARFNGHDVTEKRVYLSHSFCR